MNLTSSLRAELKKPLGMLTHDLTLINRDAVLITVGDEASKTLLEAGFKPKVVVYDGKTARKPVEVPKIVGEYGTRSTEVANPAGTLQEGVFKVFREALEDDGLTRVFVDGEEDLTALAAVNEAPSGSIVVYGQPGGGLVLIEVNEDIKEKVSKIIGEMEDGG
jgi:uncharacterized protein (UPF0218 family)